MKKRGIIIIVAFFIMCLPCSTVNAKMSLETDKKIEEFQNQYQEELKFLKEEKISLEWESQIVKANYNVIYLNDFVEFYNNIVESETGKGKNSFVLSLVWEPVFKQKEEKRNWNCFEVPIKKTGSFYDPLVLGVLKERKRENTNSNYCGTITELEDVVLSTKLKEYTVCFNSKRELLKALEKKDICGLFLPKQLLEKVKGIEIQPELNIESQLYLYIPENLIAYKRVILDMILLFEEVYEPSWNTHISWMQKMWKIELVRILIFVITGLISFFIVGMFIKKKKREKQFVQLEHTMDQRTSDEVVLYVDQKHAIIYCRQWGKLFPNIKKKRLRGIKIKSLCQMVGFDYGKYYDFIKKQNNREFRNEYTIYQRGSAYRFLERGCINGDYIVSIIYKKEI